MPYYTVDFASDNSLTEYNAIKLWVWMTISGQVLRRTGVGTIRWVSELADNKRWEGKVHVVIVDDCSLEDCELMISFFC